MSNFNIDDEIDKTVDKIAEQLKSRLKKLVIRSEKQVLRQYIASQKETTKIKYNNDNVVEKLKSKKKSKDNNKKVNISKKIQSRRIPKCEDDYDEFSESEYSGSGSESN